MTKKLVCLIMAALVTLGLSPGTACAAEGMFNTDEQNKYVHMLQATHFEPDHCNIFLRQDVFSYPQTPRVLTNSVTLETDVNSTPNACYPGDRGEAVANLQQCLKNLEYYDYSRITGYYGPVTYEAVKRFQRVNGLAANGVAEAETMALIASGRAASLCLYPGDRGRNVLWLQQRLNNLGYFKGEITGCLDAATVQALQEFQAQTGCCISSRADQSTLKRLEAADAPRWDGIRRVTGSNLSTISTTPVDKMLSLAVSLIGCPYAYHAEGPSFFDTDGFICYVLRYIGAVPKYIDAATLSNIESWEKIIDINALTRGDILFFKFSSGVVHAGISLGNGRFIHSSASKGGVVISRLAGQYQRRFLFARRIY